MNRLQPSGPVGSHEHILNRITGPTVQGSSLHYIIEDLCVQLIKCYKGQVHIYTHKNNRTSAELN